MTFEVAARVGRVRHGLARGLSTSSMLLGALGYGWAVLLHPPDAPSAPWFVVLIGALVAMVASYVVPFVPSLSDGRVAVRDGQMTVRWRGKVIAVQAASASVSTAARAGAHAEVTTPSGDVWEFEVAEPAQATALVAALGFGPGGKPTTYRLASKARRFLHLAVGYGAYNFGSMLGMLVAIALVAVLNAAHVSVGESASRILLSTGALLGAVLLYALGKRVAAAPIVTVGSDGVSVRKFGFQKRFYALADIVSAEQMAYGTPVGLRLRDGRVVTIGGVGIDAARRDGLADHVRALLAKRDATGAVQGETFARAGRSVREWREQLRELMAGGYRVASVVSPDETLAELVAKPGVPIEQRVGAALALRISGNTEARARIRVAAENCVGADARAVLEAAAEEEVKDEEIERLLRTP